MRRVATTLALTLLLVSASASVQAADDQPWSLALTGQSLQSKLFLSDEETDIGLGLRLARRLSPRWSVEGEFLRVEGNVVPDGVYIADDPFIPRAQIGLWILEFSARYDLVDRERFDFFVFGGLGWTHSDLNFLGDAVDDSVISQHLGLGIETDISQRTFLRADVRQRYADTVDHPVGDPLALSLVPFSAYPLEIDRGPEVGISVGFRW